MKVLRHNHGLGFQHQWTDPATGNVNTGARWYQPSTGTFASRDTAALDPADLADANRHAYAASSPLSTTDRSGYGSCSVVSWDCAFWDIVNNSLNDVGRGAKTAGRVIAGRIIGFASIPVDMVVNAPSTASGCLDQLYDDFGNPCPGYQPNRGSSKQGTWHDSVDYGGFGGVTTPGVVPGGYSPTGSVSPSGKWTNGVQRTSRGGAVAVRDDHAVRVIRNALRAVAAPAAAAAVSSGVQALIDAANTAAPINLGTLNSGDSTDRGFVPGEVTQGPRLGGVVPAQGKLTNGCQHGGYQRMDYSSGDISRGSQIWVQCDVQPRYRWGVPGMDKELPAVDGTWLRGSHGNAARIPGQIAKVLDGRPFNTFDDFREAFWTAVAGDATLASQFSPSNQSLMARGRAPFVHPSQQHDGQERYVLHHIQPIQHEGGVYDMNNIVVVTPKYHAEVLWSKYHYGKG